MNKEPLKKASSNIRHNITKIMSHKGSFIVFLICLTISLGFLLIASKSSPLYPINDWVDPHAFFTVGKGMMNGLVPYRDLFEQKGPLLHFIYGVGYLIANTSFLGVFVLEVLFFTVFLFFNYKILCLFVNFQYAIITLPLLASSILNLRSFAHGGSAEQFSLMFIIISLYYLLRYAKEIYPKPMPDHWIWINGFLAGCILWIKYSFLGFWFGWMAIIFFSLLLTKNHTRLINTCLAFLGGMLVATLPWIIYFGVNQSISDWLNNYFIINITAYPQDLSWREITWVVRMSLQRHIDLNPFSLVLMILGTIIFVTNRKFIKPLIFRMGLIFSIGCLGLGVYAGGRDFIYYFFIFSPFIVFGFIIVACLYYEAYTHIKPKIFFPLILILVVMSSWSYTIRFNRNTYMLGDKKENYVQFRFADIILKSENKTLLNYNFPDGGFFTTTGMLPTTRFFQSVNIDYSAFPLVVDEQNRYIKEGTTEFIVMRVLPTVDPHTMEIHYLYENYQLIETQIQPFGDIEFKYLLFSRIN